MNIRINEIKYTLNCSDEYFHKPSDRCLYKAVNYVQEVGQGVTRITSKDFTAHCTVSILIITCATSVYNPGKVTVAMVFTTLLAQLIYAATAAVLAVLYYRYQFSGIITDTDICPSL